MAEIRKMTLEKLAQKMDQGFTRANKRSDKFAQAILDLLDEMKDVQEDMATKKDINDIITTLDKHTVILIKLDQERLFTIERIKRLESEIEKIKKYLSIK